MSSLVEYSNISYIPAEPPNHFHTFDLYIPNRDRHEIVDTLSEHTHVPHTTVPPLVCFIHGGAWRSEDKLDHVQLARRLATATGCAVAVPNYRLSPQSVTDAEDAPDALRHPAHARDVLCFLEFARAWDGPLGISESVYDPGRLCLVGHSCGAHIISSIFLESADTREEDSLHPSSELLENTEVIVMSEGIYDIDLLLLNFPAYGAWFIEAAFGRRSTYQDVSVTKMTPRMEYRHLQWVIVHSKGDTLVNEAQSEAMYQHLLDKVPHVTKNFEELEEEHDVILTGEGLVKIVGQYILDKIA